MGSTLLRSALPSRPIAETANEARRLALRRTSPTRAQWLSIRRTPAAYMRITETLQIAPRSSEQRLDQHFSQAIETIEVFKTVAQKC